MPSIIALIAIESWYGRKFMGDANYIVGKMMAWFIMVNSHMKIMYLSVWIASR